MIKKAIAPFEHSESPQSIWGGGGIVKQRTCIQESYQIIEINSYDFLNFCY